MKSSRLTPKHKPHMTERRETSPHWSERLVSAILQRDNIMITELHQMNQNIQRLLTTQIEHNQEIKNILQSHRSHEREHHHHNHHHDSQRHHHTTPNIAEDEQTLINVGRMYTTTSIKPQKQEFEAPLHKVLRFSSDQPVLTRPQSATMPSLKPRLLQTSQRVESAHLPLTMLARTVQEPKEEQPEKEEQQSPIMLFEPVIALQKQAEQKLPSIHVKPASEKSQSLSGLMNISQSQQKDANATVPVILDMMPDRKFFKSQRIGFVNSKEEDITVHPVSFKNPSKIDHLRVQGNSQTPKALSVRIPTSSEYSEGSQNDKARRSPSGGSYSNHGHKYQQSVYNNLKDSAVSINELNVPGMNKMDLKKSYVGKGQAIFNGNSFPTRLALVQFQQRELIVPIMPIVNTVISQPGEKLSISKANLSISKWVAEVYDTLSHQTFSGYFSRHLSEADAKVFFTHNLALNFQHMIQYFWQNHKDLWLDYRESLIRHFEIQSSNTLQFMMVKYPQKKKTYISEEIRNAIPVKDESEDTSFDIIRNTKTFFTYDRTMKSYSKNIKILLNKLITESAKNLPQFRRIMRKIFTIKKNGYDHELKNLIGMKFKENTPLYTKKEIEEDGIKIKAPEILRIIIKWIGELEKKVKNLGKGISIHNSFTVKDEDASDHLNKFMKQDIKTIMAEKMLLLDRAEEEMRLRIRSVLSMFPQYLDKYMNYFAYIKPTEVKSGLLSFVLSETASNLSINYLLFIIDLLEEGSTKIRRFQGKGEVKVPDSTGNIVLETAEFKDFQFVSFTVSDLLRCKCSGSLTEIKEVYAHLSSDPRLTVYRVKNRLDTSNRDFLLNARLNNTPILCQIQLTITDKTVDQKQIYLNHFSHFIYELSRASYGPIAEAVIINSYLTEFVSFFRDSISKIVEERNALKDVVVKCTQDGNIEIQGHMPRNNNFTFLCRNCFQLRIANTSHLLNFDSSFSILAHDAEVSSYEVGHIKSIICGDCAYNSLAPDQQSTYLLKPPLSYFFTASPTKQLYPNLICVVPKNTSSRKHIIMQKCSPDRQAIFVPVFYESDPDKLRISEKNIEQNYYLFKKKDNLKAITVDTRRFLSQIVKDEETFKIISTLLQTFGDLEIQQSEQEYFEAYRDKQVTYAAEQINAQQLVDKQIQKIDIVISQECNSVLVLNSHLTQEELCNMIKKGRELKEADINILLKNVIWKLENSNLDNESFQIPIFTGQDVNHVLQILASDNYFTKLNFITSLSVKKIDVSANLIRKLQLDQRDFPNLIELDLTGNQIEMIACLHHGNLKTLLLGSNKLNKIHEENWRVPFLERLQLNNNNITNLNLNKLKTHKLRHLDLWDNSMETINLSSNLYTLESLLIHSNKLKILDFSRVVLNVIKQINISKNQISQLKLPPNLDYLQILTATRNCLTSIDLSTTQMNRIFKLELQINNIQNFILPRNTEQLRILNLSDNALKTLDLTPFKLPLLTQLTIQSNPLQKIHLPVRLPNLHHLSLSDNFFELIDFQKQSMPELVSLKLERNRLTDLKLPQDLTKLELIQLNNNNLIKLGFRKLKLKSLKKLSGNNNIIFNLELPESIPLLQELDCQSNKLTIVDFSKTEMKKVKIINMKANLLSKLNLGVSLDELEILDLTHNKLTELDLSNLPLSNLKQLLISTNLLTMLKFPENKVVQNLAKINAMYNPFSIPIPSNVQIQKGPIFPGLETIYTGVSNIVSVALWLLWSQPHEQRLKIYQDTNRRKMPKVDPALIEKLLSLVWEEEDITPEVKQQCITLTEMLRYTKNMPDIFRSQISDLVRQSTVSR